LDIIDCFQERPRAILSQGFDLPGISEVTIKKIESGRVNETYLVSSGNCERYILQKLNGFFGSAEMIGENWHSVGQALNGVKVGFPKLTRSKLTGWLYHTVDDSSVWRLTDFLPGRPPDKMSPEEAGLCAQTLGLCHKALNIPRPVELKPSLDNLEVPVEFTNQKLCTPTDFEIILAQYRGHPHLASLISDIKRGIYAVQQLPARPTYLRVFVARDLVIHRDCKAANFLIAQEMISLIDWDTVGYGDPLLDIGEMCRSWAVSPVAPFYKAELATAVIEGYRQTGLNLSRAEYQLLPAVVRGLALNLARRYLTDALAEVYFKLETDTYTSLYQQNMLRGRHMLDLAEELLEREIELMSI
jgi:Ser/Thr protein kinase RdoA (MazF antagonist)